MIKLGRQCCPLTYSVPVSYTHLFAEVSEEGEEIWQQLAAHYTPLAAYSFMLFNLLCAPCFAAMGAIKREMNSTKWTCLAIGYQMCIRDSTTTGTPK